MGKYCSCKRYNKYVNYILLTIFFSIISTALFGNGYCNDSGLIYIARIFNEETRNTLITLSHHLIIHNIYRNVILLIISIILYNIEIYTSKSVKSKEKVEKAGVELIYEDALEELGNKSTFPIIFILLLFNIQDILTLFYFQFDLSQFNLYILELPLLSYFNYKILNIKIYSHHKFAMYSSVIVCLISRIINFFVYGFNEDFKDYIYNKYKFLYLIGIITYLIIIAIRSFTLVKIKEFIDIKCISPTKLLIVNGIIGILINTIIMVIFSYIKCGTVEEIDIHLCNIDENSTREETYFENMFIYFKILKDSRAYEVLFEVFASIVGSIFYSFYLYFYFSIIKYLSAIHTIFYSFIFAFCVQTINLILTSASDSYENKTKFSVIILIFTIISDIFAGFGICVYCEAFELNFCNFNYNLRINIITRSEDELNLNKELDKISNVTDDEDEGDEIENEKDMSNSINYSEVKKKNKK